MSSVSTNNQSKTIKFITPVTLPADYPNCQRWKYIMPRSATQPPPRAAPHLSQTICSQCLHLQKERNCKQLETWLWETIGPEQVHLRAKFSFLEQVPARKTRCHMPWRGGRGGGGQGKGAKPPAKLRTQSCYVDSAAPKHCQKYSKGHTLFTSEPSHRIVSSRQRPSLQLHSQQAPWVPTAWAATGCSVRLQCKRVADSGNLFIPVM